MKKMFYVVIMLSQAFFAISYSKPMESHTNYNVILVHGAGGRYFGLDCENNSDIRGAWTYLKPNENDTATRQENYLTLTGGYGKVLDVDPNFSFGEGLNLSVLLKKRESSAKDMDMEDDDGKNVGLRHWLTDSLFGGDKSVIYLQRPFTNPANSPINNARELGSRTWKGNNKCEIRRSLIEEAQEVRAKGRTNLAELRKNIAERDQLPPSRNILIAHSMGGVTSREYVQGNNYNNDVDKVITLDSPHEGTGALNMLLGMSDAADHSIQTVTSSLAGLATTGLILAATSKDITAATVALYGFILPTGMNATTYALGQGLIKFLDKHYQRDDPLTPYIDPTRSNSSQDGIVNLKNRQYTDNLPMMRLLYGENSMTFSEPNDAKATSGHNVFLPKAFNSFFYNLDSQVSGGGSLTVDFINSVTSAIAGALFGVIIGDHGTTLIPQESGEAKNTKAFDDHRANVIKRSYDGHIYKGLDKAIETIPVVMAGTAAAIVAVDKMLFLSPYVGEAVKTGIAIAAGLAVATEIGLAFTAGINDLAGSHEAPLLREYQEKWRAEKNTFSTISGDPGEYKPYRMEEFLYEKPFINLRVTSTNDKLKEPLNTNLGFNYLEVQKDNQNSV